MFLYGKKDVFRRHFISHCLYSGEKLIIWYDGGHTFPKTFTEEEDDQVRDFLKRQYLRKYGQPQADRAFRELAKM